MSATKILIGILVIIGISVGGYFVWENYLRQEEMPVNTQKNVESEVESEEEKNEILTQDDRDNQRTVDILTISKALENYASDHDDKYPETNGLEKISNKENPSFIALKNSGYLKELYADPLPDKYYYGYNSNGSVYELTAVLEDRNDERCVTEGNLCIYRFKKGEIKEEKKEIKGNEDLVKNISPIELLPELGKYGFETKKTIEMTQDEWIDLYMNIGTEYGIGILEKEDIEKLNPPMLSVIREYKRNDETLSIKIYKFENEKNAKKWFNSEVDKLEELRVLLKNSKKLSLDIKEVKIQNCESYYSVYGYGTEETNYESSVFGYKEVEIGG